MYKAYGKHVGFEKSYVKYGIYGSHILDGAFSLLLSALTKKKKKKKKKKIAPYLLLAVFWVL